VALADPQSITIGSAISLGRTQDDAGTSLYRSADLLTLETVSAQITKAKRLRSTLRVDLTKVAADPISAVNTSLTGTVSVVFDFPNFGFSDTDKTNMWSGINTQLTASTNLVLLKILHLEH